VETCRPAAYSRAPSEGEGWPPSEGASVFFRRGSSSSRHSTPRALGRFEPLRRKLGPTRGSVQRLARRSRPLRPEQARERSRRIFSCSGLPRFVLIRVARAARAPQGSSRLFPQKPVKHSRLDRETPIDQARRLAEPSQECGGRSSEWRGFGAENACQIPGSGLRSCRGFQENGRHRMRSRGPCGRKRGGDRRCWQD
jgi:hypothetical protein